MKRVRKCKAGVKKYEKYVSVRKDKFVVRKRKKCVRMNLRAVKIGFMSERGRNVLKIVELC